MSTKPVARNTKMIKDYLTVLQDLAIWWEVYKTLECGKHHDKGHGISGSLSVCSVMYDSLLPHGLQPAWLLCPWDFPVKNTGAGCHFLLQGIFPAQGSNPCLLRLLHWQADSLPWGHLGSPLILIPDPYQMYVFQTFSPTLWILPHFLDRDFWSAKVFKLNLDAVLKCHI